MSIDTSLFDWPAPEPRLKGSACESCGTVAFPPASTCPRCCGTRMQGRLLATHGTLHTWTTQSFAPKSPPYRMATGEAPFAPYFVGYVELPGELCIESRLEADDPSRFAIGLPMRLAIRPAWREANGDEVMTFVFEPDGAAP